MRYKRVLYYPSGGLLSAPAAYSLSVTDSISETDTLVKSTGKNLTDSVTPSESFSTLFVQLLNITESVTITDLLIKKAITKNLIDSITPSEVFSTIHGYFKTLTDSISPAETFSYTKLKLKTFVDSIPLVEKMWQFLNNVLVEPFIDLYRKQYTNYEEEDLYH